MNKEVYFISADGTDFIKIGKTVGIGGRISALQTGCPFELNVLYMTKEIEEFECHELFKDLNHRSEWFKITKADLFKIIISQYNKINKLKGLLHSKVIEDHIKNKILYGE